ncbi:TPA: hypothetical protein DD455_03650 [Candidatus Shapirobacteria bacterium]|nr:hypothetical protein [Candidatus Shapirobacteria bacterium]
MSLRSKTNLILGIAILIIFSITAIYSYTTLLPGYYELEKKSSQDKIQQVIKAFDREISFLGTKLTDWSNWDDTYNFIEDSNQAYIDSNLLDDSLNNLRINYMFFFNQNNQLVYQKGYDYHRQQPITDFTDWQPHLTPDNILTNTQPGNTNAKSGFLVVSGKPAIFFSNPILDSSGSENSRGTIVFVKILAEADVAQISQTVGMEMSFHALSNLPHPRDLQVSQEMINNGDIVKIDNMDNQTAVGYSLFNDFYTKPSLLLHLDLDRQISQQGSVTIKSLLSFLAIGYLLILLFSIILLYQFVINKILYFKYSINNIVKTKDFSKRLLIKGSDEVAQIGININTLLTSFEDSQSELVNEQARSKIYFQTVGIMMMALDIQGNIVMINKKGLEILNAQDEKDLIGKNWFDNFIPPALRSEVKNVFASIIAGETKYTESYENEIITLTGQTKIIDWSNSPIKNKNGQVAGMVNSGIDITQEKAIEEAEDKKNEELKRLNDLMVGREIKMMELKKEISKLIINEK